MRRIMISYPPCLKNRKVAVNSETQPLDELCSQALAGDSRAEAALFSALRVRFLQLAKRRVQTDHSEDVVQDALKIVCDRYRERKQGMGILVWSLTILRNVIGNHYQSRQRERQRMEFVEEYPSQAMETANPLSLAECHESQLLVQKALQDLAIHQPRCGRMFAHLVASHELGGTTQEISSRALASLQKEEPTLTPGSFYTALHRCRARLKVVWANIQGEQYHA